MFCAILSYTAALPSHAHEVIPAVADLSISHPNTTLKIRLTSEAILAGIDLSAVIDTNDADQADDYDRLRKLAPDDLTQNIFGAWPTLATDIFLYDALGNRLMLNLVGVRVDPIGDTDLPRYTVLDIETKTPTPPTITVGWAAKFGGLVVRQIGVENGATEFLSDGRQSQSITGAGMQTQRSPLSVLIDYIPTGFDHIVPKGLDHILFVLGLFFLSAGLRALLLQITAFTFAHTLTLAAGALGWVNVPGAIVEPLIAASIVYVAIENIFIKRLTLWRPFVIFGFGLLHGLGFASVLGEFGLPQGQFIPALIGFNIGVELGQITVIAVAFAAVGFVFGHRDWYRSRIAIPASLMIASVGAWWFLERVFL